MESYSGFNPFLVRKNFFICLYLKVYNNLLELHGFFCQDFFSVLWSKKLKEFTIIFNSKSERWCKMNKLA